MPEAEKSYQVARFEDFELDLRSAELRRHGHRSIRLADQPFRILITLLGHPQEVVLREEIRKKLWPNDTIVEFEHSISAAMNRLRQALGDSAESPCYIQTLARRGYRWMVPVEWIPQSPTVATPPTVATATKQPTGESLIGKKVSHYRILEVLGGGGMGVVYKAEDLRLGRCVAIKFLGEEFVGDRRALERFEREARAISALDYPNICTIYEVEDHQGQPFIVMQLLQGETLRQRIESAGSAKSSFSQSELLDFGIQIATGLEAAHQKGIIHRDVKPANIFITNRGEIKLLDFGLAKLVGTGGVAGEMPATKQRETGPQDSALAGASKSNMTLTGATMGTASYMSPEQVRREQLDACSDLFSFGVVLYEMATGHQPFRGHDLQAIHDAILNHTPPSPLTLNPDLPMQLEPIIGRALEKNRENRYQSASELRADLKRLKRDSESGGVGQVLTAAAHDAAASAATVVDTTVAIQPARGLGRQIYFSLAAFAMLLMAVYAAYRYWPASKASTQLAKLSQISHWNKPMNGARLSPDGRMVAFSSRVGIVEQVFVILTSGGEPLQLTHDEGNKYVSNFSPDGTEIYYGRALGADEEWAVSTLGGTPRRVASGCCLAPSPDGSSLFYLKSASHAVFRAGKSGLNEEKIYSFDNPALLPLSLLPFPNGKDLLVTAVARLSDQQIGLYKLNVPSRTAVDLGALPGPSDGLVWAEPGKTLLLSRNVNGLINLWNYSLVDHAFTQVTSDPGPDRSPMPDPATKGIYYVNGKSSGLLTVYHVHSNQFVEIGSENASQPSISPDGMRVMYIRYVGPGKTELWMSNLDDTDKIKVASSGELFTGDWAPNGSQLAFFDNTGGDGKGYVVGVDGRGLRPIGRVEEPIDWIAWSADGKSLYVTTWKNQSERRLWKAYADGSELERFLDSGCTVMDASPGGRYLLGSLVWGNEVGISEISIIDKKRIPLLPGVETQPTRFAPDGKSFLYAVFSRGGVTLYRQAWRDGKLVGKPQTALKVPVGFGLFYGGNALDFTRDLSVVVYARASSHADLYLLSGAR
jgi:DNA-binding winged helix-turn-helix (wHTH) protein/Tol biopolymer transport system component